MFQNLVSSAAVVLIAALTWFVGAPQLNAQPAAAGGDEAAVRKAGKDYQSTVDRGDIKALADFWTADGTYTDDSGRTSKVHDLFAKDSSSGQIIHPQIEASNVSIHFLTPNVAVEEGECSTPAINGFVPVTGRYTALWVHQAGRWKLDNLRESRTETSSGSDQLALLDVFAGQWSGETNQLNIQVNAKWNRTKTFLRRDFTVSSGGKAIFSGAQEIGWDPVSRQLRSWMFNDDGSYGTGNWSLEGTVWMVMSSRILPDGKLSKATHVYKFPDKNTMIWKSIRGSIDGQLADDFEIVLKRAVEPK
jgi:ketosteroid isomerase-like protein